MNLDEKLLNSVRDSLLVLLLYKNSKIMEHPSTVIGVRGECRWIKNLLNVFVSEHNIKGFGI